MHLVVDRAFSLVDNFNRRLLVIHHLSLVYICYIRYILGSFFVLPTAVTVVIFVIFVVILVFLCLSHSYFLQSYFCKIVILRFVSAVSYSIWYRPCHGFRRHFYG